MDLAVTLVPAPFVSAQSLSKNLRCKGLLRRYLKGPGFKPGKHLPNNHTCSSAGHPVQVENAGGHLPNSRPRTPIPGRTEPPRQSSLIASQLYPTKAYLEMGEDTCPFPYLNVHTTLMNYG